MPKKPTFKTEPHCYMFFKEDIKEMTSNGWTPKEVFRLGILAKKENPQMITRLKELEENNKSISEKLSRVARKNFELEEELEKRRNQE